MSREKATRSFYDAVFLGASLEALVASSLLAKRGFRVLVLGQGVRPPRYRAAGRAWPRRANTFLAAPSPVARRTLSELALHQAFRRRAHAIDPALQFVQPGLRFDLALDPPALEREVDRELRPVKRAVQDFHRACADHADDLDRIVDRDLTWPPVTFFERRELARASAQQAFGRNGDAIDPFAEFPDPHAFRSLVDAATRFATSMDPHQLNPLSIVRLYGAWLRGAVKLEGGRAWLHDALAEKLTTYSGEIRLRESADAIRVRRGVATGVRIAGTAEEVGAGFVVCGREVGALLPLLPDRALLGQLFERHGEPTPRWFRYTLNVVTQAHALPSGMSRDVFFLRDPARPRADANLLRLEAHPVQPPSSEHGETRMLTIEALLPRRGVEEVTGYVSAMREKILATLGELVPFLGDHVLLVDSPHDGRDVQDVAGGKLLPPETPWERGPRTMPALYGFPGLGGATQPGALGVCGVPMRTPVRRLLLCNAQVVPALGDEGSFLTAWSVARHVAKSDKRKEWMRRGLWD